MNRFDRITTILIQLQSKRVVKAQDLADRFEVSLRTIYRDIRTLEEAGVPLYGEAGVGYSIVDGYRLPPVMFTKEEAMAFVTAEKLMERLTDKVIQKHFQSAMYKVKSVLRGSEKDFVENLESQIHVRDRQIRRPEAIPGNILEVLFRGISEKKVVKMTYRALGREEKTERFIEPIGVYHENDHWYTIGYCHLREDYRHFRADRIYDIRLTDRDRLSERATLQEYQEQWEKKRSSYTMQKVVIRVEKSIIMYLQERKYYFGFVSETEKDNMIEMTFLTASLENGFVRWYLTFADYAEIVEPVSLKKKIRDIVEKISERI
ncbi:helix-turn-helix transcriptional regulator [Sinomicrobium weinanense]|uniref:YafY family transcriptional regulator n=1 Tax=Sinomicrobium weinanense TaxID=2842200 RepID=A0A926Q2T2_9FLAO|nr:YafY family protein [Sinomicrobium weinanense]MBC9796853.1 YafY family transcriptional regulator [Sinomicrobium weinanense]